MADVWSEETKLAHWLRIEVLAVDAWARLGRIPHADADAVRAGAEGGPPSPERVAEIERRTHHDVAAFVEAAAEPMGEAGERWLHFGLTSSDLLDTALALQMQAAVDLILARLERLLAVVRRRALEHRATLTIGRTHGVHAEPTTFGHKMALWAFELDRDRSRLRAAREAISVGKLSGVVGSYSQVDPAVEEDVCARLGLRAADAASQVIQRDVHAEFCWALAITAATLDKMATEVRHLARTEVREVQEPFVVGQKGSSAMPHKRNPIICERVSGLARLVRSNLQAALEDIALWHERDISHSSAERVVVPDAFLAVDYMLDRFAWLVEGLVVREERMRRNLEASHYLFFSQRVLLALVESGLQRDDAYRLVQRNAMRAWDEELDFRELARGDEEIAARVDLDTIFDLDAYTRHVDTVFARLNTIAAKEEPVHA
jgi:adenylosuccinate lyase